MLWRYATAAVKTWYAARGTRRKLDVYARKQDEYYDLFYAESLFNQFNKRRQQWR